MRNAPGHHETRPGGESTNSTLVSLYLILLSFFIAMQAILGAEPLPFASDISPQSDTERGARMAINGQGQYAGQDSSMVDDMRALIADYPGVDLRVEGHSRLSMELEAQQGFFFAPEAVQLRLDRLELLEAIAQSLSGRQWRLAVYLPQRDELKLQRLQAFHKLLSPVSPLLGVQVSDKITLRIYEASDA